MKHLLPATSWERNQWVTTAMVFVVFVAFAFVIPFLPLYVRELGVQDPEAATLWAGVLIGVSPLLAGLLAPVWGRLADRYGQKVMAVRALSVSVVFLVASGLVRTVEQLLVCRVATGLFGGIGPLGLAMASALAPKEHLGRAVGLVQAAQILSAAVGPVMGGLLADRVGRRTTFFVTGGLCLVALVLLVALYEEAPRDHRAAAASARSSSFFGLLRRPGVRPLLAVLFLVNFVGRSITPILPAHLERLGVDAARLASSTGLVISAYAVMAAVSAAALGRATRTRSPQRLLVASVLLGAVVLLPMVHAPSYPVFVLLAIALGLAGGGALTLCYTMGGALVPPEDKTAAFGFFSAAALFGGAVSPAVAGWLARFDLLFIYKVDTVLFAALGLWLLRAPGTLAARADEAAEPPTTGPEVRPEGPTPAG